MPPGVGPGTAEVTWPQSDNLLLPDATWRHASLFLRARNATQSVGPADMVVLGAAVDEKDPQMATQGSPQLVPSCLDRLAPNRFSWSHRDRESRRASFEPDLNSDASPIPTALAFPYDRPRSRSIRNASSGR
jgi:hypothetical protein